MQDMRTSFVNDFTAKINGKVTDEDLITVREMLMKHVCDYEITDRETALALYEDLVPKCYEAFMVVKKIEGRSMNTLAVYNHHLMDFFYNVQRPIEQITEADIYMYLYKRQQGKTGKDLDNRTIDHIRLIINGFLQWCSDSGYIPKNPCKTISPIKFTEKPREPLTDDELELVRDACQTLKEKAIIEMLYSTGCRVSEFCNMKIHDIDMQKREVMVLGKGAKYRTVYINPRAYIALQKYLLSRPDKTGGVIVNDRKPYNQTKPGGIRLILSDIGERAGLNRPLTPHVLRHTLATNLVRRGVPVERIQRLLGHEKTDTTMLYAKIITEDVRDAVMRYA